MAKERRQLRSSAQSGLKSGPKLHEETTPDSLKKRRLPRGWIDSRWRRRRPASHRRTSAFAERRSLCCWCISWCVHTARHSMPEHFLCLSAHAFRLLLLQTWSSPPRDMSMGGRWVVRDVPGVHLYQHLQCTCTWLSRVGSEVQGGSGANGASLGDVFGGAQHRARARAYRRDGAELLRLYVPAPAACKQGRPSASVPFQKTQIQSGTWQVRVDGSARSRPSRAVAEPSHER